MEYQPKAVEEYEGLLPLRIEDTLPTYYEAHHRSHITYEVERSLVIDGHEVAWLKYTGTRDDGSTFEGRELACVCKFIEGVGWGIDEKYGVTGIVGWEKCPAFAAAQELRKEELRDEYQERFGDVAAALPEIIEDLFEKDSKGQFIGEGSNGAHFWGGHFYLQTLGDITGLEWSVLWPQIDALVIDKKIQMEGMVVQEYYEPPAPQWERYGERHYDGFSIQASLPTHTHMPQVWHYTVVDGQGQPLADDLVDIPGSRLNYEPTFGVDMDDVQAAEHDMDKLAARIIEERTPDN